jgi:hypothetical protein
VNACLIREEPTRSDRTRPRCSSPEPHLELQPTLSRSARIKNAQLYSPTTSPCGNVKVAVGGCSGNCQYLQSGLATGWRTLFDLLISDASRRPNGVRPAAVGVGNRVFLVDSSFRPGQCVDARRASGGSDARHQGNGVRDNSDSTTETIHADLRDISIPSPATPRAAAKHSRQKDLVPGRAFRYRVSHFRTNLMETRLCSQSYIDRRKHRALTSVSVTARVQSHEENFSQCVHSADRRSFAAFCHQLPPTGVFPCSFFGSCVLNYCGSGQSDSTLTAAPSLSISLRLKMNLYAQLDLPRGSPHGGCSSEPRHGPLQLSGERIDRR